MVTAGEAGPVVVLVPGTNLNTATSTGLVDALAVDHRVVDCFFPPQRVATVVRERLGIEPTVVAGAGHVVPEEDPRAVVDAVRRTSGS